MATVSPSQSSDGETIEAADINTPINELAAVINGGIDEDNITSDRLGPTAWKNPYCFSAYLSADDNGNTDNTTTEIAVDTEHYDYNNNLDTGTGEYTAPFDGVFHFNGHVRIENTGNDIRDAAINILVNGTTNYQMGRLTRSTNTDQQDIQMLSGSLDVLLTSGDTVKYRVFCNSDTGTYDIISGANDQGTIWRGHLVHKV